MVRNFDVELLPLMVVGKAATGIGMAVGIGQIGFDVIDGGSIKEVGAKNLKRHIDRVDSSKTNDGESEVVGTEGRTRGPHPYPLVASQQGRADSRMLLGINVLREAPDKPHIIITVKAPQSLWLPISRQKRYGASQLWNDSALTGYSKLGRQR